MLLLRPPTRLPWRRVHVARIDLEDWERGWLTAEGGRRWRLRPHLLAEPGDAVHDAYCLALSRLTAGIGDHRVARIKTRWGRVIGIGHAIPHVDRDELPILSALGVDIQALTAYGRDHMIWNSWHEDQARPHPHATISDGGRAVVRIDLGHGVTYSIGAFRISGLPDTIAHGAVGLPLSRIIQDDRLDALGLTVRSFGTEGGSVALHVIDPPSRDARDRRHVMLDGESRHLFA